MPNLYKAARAKKAYGVCKSLRALFDAHCEEEEKFLHEADFPRLADHLETHVKVKEILNTACTTCLEVCKDNRGGACLADLSSIFIDHFLQGDMYFKSFLQTRGLAMNNR